MMQVNVIIVCQIECYLVVKVYVWIVGIGDVQFDVGVVIDDDWLIGQGMWVEWDKCYVVDGWMDDWFVS